jgi:hypothetical protein
MAPLATLLPNETMCVREVYVFGNASHSMILYRAPLRAGLRQRGKNLLILVPGTYASARKRVSATYRATVIRP